METTEEERPTSLAIRVYTPLDRVRDPVQRDELDDCFVRRGDVAPLGELFPYPEAGTKRID
jgi:hypothetical protein